jgi:hypothetical protein
MNTGQKNSQGRTIYRGPRGGEYVLGPAGQKIRSFSRALVAAAPAVSAALTNAKAHMNTLKTMKARKNYLRTRAINMTLENWKVLGRHKNTLNYEARVARAARAGGGAAPVAVPVAPPAVPPAVAKKLAKMLKLTNNEYINRYGMLHNSQARLKLGETHLKYNSAKTRAFNKDPKFLVKHQIPYIYNGRPNQAFMTKLKLKYSKIVRSGTTANGRNIGVNKKVYFNKKGDLYYISLNGKKHRVDDHRIQQHFWLRNPREFRNLKRTVGAYNPNYPISAIPPASPVLAMPARRSSPQLLESMMNQIYNGGRGSNINASRYTNEERNVLVRRLGGSIAYFKQMRNAKKEEAAKHRENLRATGMSNANKQALRTRAAAANERVGYFNNAVRAYTRGLRAVKPLTGAVTPRARAMPNTPNRYTPAPANVENNAIYMPLNKPHLVVKVPGAGTIYLNPNTFRGFMKNSARVNIAEANVRNWLRMARRNFPNEPLFRHPLAAKNVTASHIRFSRA